MTWGFKQEQDTQGENSVETQSENSVETQTLTKN